MVMRENLAAAMNAKIIGSGKETIVLGHGYGGDQSFWEKVAPLLAERHRVLLFDWCFSGAVKDPSLYDPSSYGSYDAFADDLIAVAEEMKVTSCVFVGHSMSGMIGCIASIKRPDLFTRLVLVGASPRFLNQEGYEGGFSLSQIEELFSNIESNFEEWAPAFAALVVDAGDPVSVEKFANSLKRMRPRVGLSLAKMVFLGDYRGVLEKVAVPCNIIQTRNDVVVPLGVAEYMQRKIKGECEVEVIDTEGHFPQLTAHLKFVEFLVVFGSLQTCCVAAGSRDVNGAGRGRLLLFHPHTRRDRVPDGYPSAASGLKANQLKSCIYFGGVAEDLRQDILYMTGMTEGSLPFKYLGVPLSSQKLSSSENLA